MEIEASLRQASLSSKLEEILDLKILSECFRWSLKTLLRADNCPPMSYGIFYSLPKHRRRIGKNLRGAVQFDSKRIT